MAESNASGATNGDKADKITIIAASGDLDKIWPTLILATTAAACGMEAVVFFTFWGLFALVKPERARRTGSNWMTKMLPVMNPGSADKAKLSKMNMGGAGAWMMKKLARDYKTMTPDQLLVLAQEMGVRLLPCQMTMDLMGLKADDLIEGLGEPVGAATALLEMKESSVQLFI